MSFIKDGGPLAFAMTIYGILLLGLIAGNLGFILRTHVDMYTPKEIRYIKMLFYLVMTILTGLLIYGIILAIFCPYNQCKNGLDYALLITCSFSLCFGMIV